MSPHNYNCEHAMYPSCVCHCLGILHQCDILHKVFDPNTTAALPVIQQELTNMYGHSFQDPYVAPSGGQKVRRSYNLNPGTQWTTKNSSGEYVGGSASRIEQRILDVTLKDILENTYIMNTPAAMFDLVKLITSNIGGSSNGLRNYVQQYGKGVLLSPGYHWSTMLACVAYELNGLNSNPSSYASLRNTIVKNVVNFGHDKTGVRYPRSSKVTKKNILYTSQYPYLDNRQINGIDILLQGLDSPSVQTLSRPDVIFVLSVVGSTTSADLWHHPLAVKNLLRPAVDYLRSKGCKFSLDSSSTKVENLMDRYLKAPWEKRGAW